MPLTPLPFLNPAYPNSPEFGASQGGGLAKNCYLDERGVLRKRPGLRRWTTGASVTGETGVQGCWYWIEQDKLIVIMDGRIFWSSLGSSQLTEVAGQVLDPRNPVVFAANPHWLVMTNGNKPVLWDGSNAPVTMTTDFASASHVAYLDGYFLINEVGSQRCWYTSVYDQTNPTAAPTMDSWVVVGGSGDLLRAVAVGWREALMLGDRTAEVWYNTGDATAPFRRMDGAYIERGSNSPHTLCQVDNTWFWLDHTRRMLQLEGRTPKDIGTPYQARFDALTNPGDARGFLLGRFYILTFPTDNVSFAYDTVTQAWYDWDLWEPVVYRFDRFIGQNAVMLPRTNTWLVGDRTASQMLWFNPSIYQDDGRDIRMYYRTGPIDHQSLYPKISRRLIFKVQADNRGALEAAGGAGTIVLPDGTRCSAYSYTIPQVTAFGTDMWEWTATGLPTCLTFDTATRTVSGTPCAAGDFSPIFTLTRADGFSFVMTGKAHIDDYTPSITFPGE